MHNFISISSDKLSLESLEPMSYPLKNILPSFVYYLSDRKQAVQIGYWLSSYLTCSAGVPQASEMGPVLLSICVNDLSDVCRNIKMQLYADDTVLYCHANSIQEAAARLTGAIMSVSYWF